MILLRLSPLIPYNVLDYISGITSISLLNYSLALCGILPGTILYCLVGATASSITEITSSSSSSSSSTTTTTNDDDSTTTTTTHEIVKIISLFCGIVFAILGVAVASYYSNIELHKIVQEQQQLEQQQQHLQPYVDDHDDDHEEEEDEEEDVEEESKAVRDNDDDDDNDDENENEVV